jgi:ribosome-associated toxin RatA of RatAB toxin-antitoxin module
MDKESKQKIYDKAVEITTELSLQEAQVLWVTVGQVIAQRDPDQFADFVSRCAEKEIFRSEDEASVHADLVLALGLIYQKIRDRNKERKQQTKEEEVVVNFAWNTETGES